MWDPDHVPPILAALSGALHVRAEYRGSKGQVYLFKPLTVLFIIAIALLMLSRDRFLPGTASFLLAHLAYLVAFTDGVASGAAQLLIAWSVDG